jgi:hypothetical protein
VNQTPSQPVTDSTTATEIRLREPSPPETGCSGQPGPCCRTLLPWLVRRRGLVLWVALLVSLAAAFFGVKLYSDLR